MSIVFWQTIDYSSLFIEEWNGEFTIYQSEAGKTHFLNQMGLLIIKYLSHAPAPEGDICYTLAEQFQQKCDSQFSEQVIKALHRFDELGLIEKIEFDRSA